MFEWLIAIIALICAVYVLLGVIDYILFYRYAKKKGWFKNNK